MEPDPAFALDEQGDAVGCPEVRPEAQRFGALLQPALDLAKISRSQARFSARPFRVLEPALPCSANCFAHA